MPFSVSTQVNQAVYPKAHWFVSIGSPSVRKETYLTSFWYNYFVDKDEYIRDLTQKSEEWLLARSSEVGELSSKQIDNMYQRFIRDILDCNVVDGADATRMLVILGLLACRKSELDSRNQQPNIPNGFKDLLK